MFIVSKSDVEVLKSKQASNPSIVLRYRRKLFRRVNYFADIQQAISDCREKLDSGKFCLILQDGFSGQEVWQAMGKEELRALKSQ